MIHAAPPLRFLLLAVAGWVCVRAVYLAGDGPPAMPEARRAARFAGSSAGRAVPAPAPAAGTERPFAGGESLGPVSRPSPFRRMASAATAIRRVPVPAATRFAGRGPVPPLPQPAPPYQALGIAGHAISPEPQPRLAPGLAPLLRPLSPPQPSPPQLSPRRASRWSGSAWLHLRSGGSAVLIPGGTLGGSQSGLRINYRLSPGLALSGRLYMPLDRPHGAEVAAGLDWRPLPGVPVHLVAERRQRVGPEGRSDFALTAYGGVSERRLAAGLRLDAYGQVGVVGLRARDLFADGAARIGVRLGPLDVGGGIWGAAQPGVSRLDIGPQASFRFPIAGASLRLSADWRFRIAGDAAPASGPALTLATDF